MGVKVFFVIDLMPVAALTWRKRYKGSIVMVTAVIYATLQLKITAFSSANYTKFIHRSHLSFALSYNDTDIASSLIFELIRCIYRDWVKLDDFKIF